MIKSHRAAALMIVGMAGSLSALAADVAGMVKTSSGQVVIERQGATLPAPVGTQVLVADRVRTGGDGTVGVTLRDNTLLSAGPGSLVVIDKFAFDSSTLDGRMSVGVRKGTLSVATGKIAKRTPESVDFHTPTSVLGVRGTEFIIEVAGGSNE